MSSTLCHVVVAITCALQGFGALSLAWANFAGILSFGIAASILRPKGHPWLPLFSNIKTILSFGSVATIGNAANVAGTNVPDLIVGKVMDMSSVGYLSRANGLVQLFSRFLTDALMPLILPYFADVRRNGHDLAEHYKAAVVYLTGVAWPFFAGLLILAYPMVRTLYGPQWDASVPLVELLCVAGAISSVSMFAGQVMVANGQVRNATYSQLITQPFRIAAVFFAATFSLIYIAFALIAVEFLTLCIISWYLRKTIKVGLLGVLSACGKSALITLCSAIVPLLVRFFWTDNQAHPSIPLTIGIVGAGIGWLSSILFTQHPFGPHLISFLTAAKSKIFH